MHNDQPRVATGTLKIATRESTALEAKLDAALALIRKEALRAMVKHGPMRNSHEAFGIIYEEFNIEFAEEMKTNNAERQAGEMVQVGAMAARALVDVYKVGLSDNQGEV